MSFGGTVLHGVGIALDYGAELLYSWRRGVPMTLSSRAGLALRAGKTDGFFPWLGHALDDEFPDHTPEAIQADLTRSLTAALQLLQNATPADLELAKKLLIPINASVVVQAAATLSASPPRTTPAK